MKPLRVGVIGAGRIGVLHARHLAFRIPEAEVIAVSDIRRDAAKRCAEECRVPKIYDDPRRLMEDKEIEAVIICSSTDTHTEFIEYAAENGKHIFCEKPLDVDLERIDRAIRAADKAGVKLQVGFNRRFDPNFARVLSLIHI